MENQQPQPQQPSPCRAGCGFYGSHATEGLCSKCYKDAQQRENTGQRGAQMLHPTPSAASPVSVTMPSSSVPVASGPAATSSAPIPVVSTSNNEQKSPQPSGQTSGNGSPTQTGMVEQSCAQEALSASNVTAKFESDEATGASLTGSASEAMLVDASPAAGNAIAEGSDATPPTDVTNAKKAIRCPVCNKKLKLIERFECRCGGTYCRPHSHDREHNCTFDYKAMEREAIRKNNPVVVSEKIQRL